jgi:hypothetical protein
LEDELVSAQLQLERITDNKLIQMLFEEKCSSDKIGLGYIASGTDIASTSKTMFVKPTVTEPQIACEDKGKGTIGGVAKISEEFVKKSPTKRSLPTCHHCGISGHIRPNS